MEPPRAGRRSPLHPSRRRHPRHRRRSTRSSPSYGKDIRLVVHTAAQPSHDWAAKDPPTDFSVNANGTLVMLEATRKHCPDACLHLYFHEQGLRRQSQLSAAGRAGVAVGGRANHPFTEHGIDETMSVDHTKHSLFGVSKLAADALAQEYGRYFGMKTGMLPRRLPDRAGSLRHHAPRLPLVPGQVRHHRADVHRLRLQGQAGPRQHPLLRPDQHVLAVLSDAAARRGLQRRRRPAQQLFHEGGDRALRADGPASR